MCAIITKLSSFKEIIYIIKIILDIPNTFQNKNTLN